MKKKLSDELFDVINDSWERYGSWLEGVPDQPGKFLFVGGMFEHDDPATVPCSLAVAALDTIHHLNGMDKYASDLLWDAQGRLTQVHALSAELTSKQRAHVTSP